ncbi:MAG: imidazoleglycerol-phosphate dehydratase HisB [Deltaproteobacteria bacterium]|nr:imidazoleglycerol-phosphate dehydratase HisB [Deltaproteobacteria bacterium]
MARKSTIQRNTKETQIEVDLNLDGTGKYKIDTPIPFFNHMLEQFSRHGLFDITLKAKGDTHIDYHHTVEDVGITLGEAFEKALGDKAGIKRYGHFSLPMDEVLTNVALDFCNRPALVFHSLLKTGKIKDFDVELVYEFFQGFTNAAKINLHINVMYGRNKHHIVESMFKSFAKACDRATQIDERMKGALPSTKGKL